MVSNPEDVNQKDVVTFIKEKGVENDLSKWMSSKEIYLDDHREKSVIISQFEGSKDLLKEITEAESSDTNNLSKHIADIQIY